MAADATTLQTTLQGLADFLEGLAVEMGWTPDVCVAPIEPSSACDTIHVWPGPIETLHVGNCEMEPSVTLNWRAAICVGADIEETCAWWTTGTRTSDVLQRLWGLYGGLSLAFTDKSLCAALGVSTCGDIRFGTVNPIPSADYVAYQGSLRINVGVIPLGS